jgi:hypothetical protein
MTTSRDPLAKQLAVDLVEEAITESFGERCREFEAGCPCCDAWKQYDDLRAAAAKAAKLRRPKN